jgi:arylsulfatase A-like enzyme
MDRRQFLHVTGGGLAAAASAACAHRAASSTRRPNIIFAFSDEHRWQSMARSEMPELDTPNMTRLGQQGLECTHCISNYPVCSPYRGIFLTGRWPYQQGVIDNAIPLQPSEMTVGKAFQAAGYDTAYIGKWHLGGVRAEEFGFDHSLIWTNTNAHWDKSSYHPADGPMQRPKGYNATLMTDQALEYINQERDKPFFMALSWNPPHANFLDAPEPKKDLYAEGSLSWRANADLTKAHDTEASNKIWNQNSWPHYQGYHAHVSAIDDELGRLMQALDDAGLSEDTILIYSSDHGSQLGSHGVGSKRQPYEESIRVPWIMRWPGHIEESTQTNALFGTIDIMPTLCGLAGVPIPDTCQGQDFSGRFLGRGGPDPESQFIMHISKLNASGANSHPAPRFRGVRTKQYTYAFGIDAPLCLFDNEADPFQLNNLIADPAHAGLRDALDTTLRDWLDRTEDPFQLRA